MKIFKTVLNRRYAFEMGGPDHLQDLAEFLKWLAKKWKKKGNLFDSVKIIPPDYDSDFLFVEVYWRVIDKDAMSVLAAQTKELTAKGLRRTNDED